MSHLPCTVAGPGETVQWKFWSHGKGLQSPFTPEGFDHLILTMKSHQIQVAKMTVL